MDKNVNKKNMEQKPLISVIVPIYKVNAARKSKVDDNTARMQSIKQLGV